MGRKVCRGEGCLIVPVGYVDREKWPKIKGLDATKYCRTCWYMMAEEMGLVDAPPPARRWAMMDHDFPGVKQNERGLVYRQRIGAARRAREQT